MRLRLARFRQPARRRARTAGTALVAALVLLWGPASAQQKDAGKEKELFARVDQMLGEVSEILGLKVDRPVPRAMITREKIREYIEGRIAEAIPPEELRAQEIVLKKFGYLPKDFNLKAQMVDLLTEQAAAFYDFKQKKLYLASWTPSAMQDVALVHELAHALADQHFNLEKFIAKSGEDDDAAVARGAVVEGQASWVMTEYMARQMGQSLKTSPQLAQFSAGASAEAVKQFPVLGAAPLYLQQTLMFPYTQGMLFQHAVFEKSGKAAFAEVFRRPPLSSQQVLHPERYFARAVPSKPALPSARVPAGFKKTIEGTIGELDLRILLEQYLGEGDARMLAPRWKGGRYALWEDPKKSRAILQYAVEWEGESDAAEYFDRYRKICGKKWTQLRVETEQPQQVNGTGDDGRFVWTLRGTTVTSMEGLP